VSRSIQSLDKGPGSRGPRGGRRAEPDARLAMDTVDAGLGAELA
jgi:hypothetical protein